MKRLLALALALAIPTAAPVVAQTALTDMDSALVQRSANRGLLIYAYDQAAWHGTDDMLAKAKAAGVYEALAPQVGGWVVDGTPASSTLTFFDKSPDPKAVYVAHLTISGTKLVDSRLLGADDDRTISPNRKKLIAAERTARAALEAAKVARCSDRPFNTVVLPPETPDGPTLVYFLTPQTVNDSWPMGGHYLVEVEPDGKTTQIRPFTKSCLTIAPDGKKESTAAMMVSHLLDPVPTEIHVFTMFTSKLPLFVLTQQNNLLWSVEASAGQAQIRVVNRKK